MHQAEKISLPCIYTALRPSERHHPHPPHMIPKLSDMLKKNKKKKKTKKRKKKNPNHHSVSNILHGHMFLCSLELNLLHNFSFSQMFLSRRAGKINSPRRSGMRAGGRAEPSRGLAAEVEPRRAPSQSPSQHGLAAGGHLLGTSAFCPLPRLRGSSVG